MIQTVAKQGAEVVQGGAEIGAKAVQRERRRTVQIARTLPRGIHLGERTDGRPKPFFIRSGKNRAVQSYATEEERNDAAEKLAELREREGAGMADVNLNEWRAYVEFRQSCKAPFDELLRLWSERQNAVTKSLTVETAIERYMRLRLAEDIRQDSDTHRHLKKHLVQRFAVRFAGVQFHELTSVEIREWLDSLKHPKTGQPMEKVTVRHHRKDVNTFCKRAVLEGWISRNPCEAVKPPKIEADEVNLLTPREIFDLLKANQGQPVVGRMALELFGGLRCSSVERITESQIRWESKGIRMPGALHKSGEGKFRQGHPDALWQWLTHAKPACFEKMTRAGYRYAKQLAFARANVENTGNVLRHSFASYMAALTKNMPLVGYLMQHRNTATTEGYEGIAEESDARLVFAMTPAAVTTAANFEAFALSVSTQPKPNP